MVDNAQRIFEGYLLEILLSKDLNNQRQVESKLKSQGGTNGVFGKPCFCPLPKGAVVTKTAKITNLHSTH